MTKRLLSLAVLLTVLALTGCGSTTPATSTSKPLAPSAASQAVETAKAVCGTVSREKFASDFGMNTTNPTLLAQRYARGYDEQIRSQVQDACVRAMTR